MASSYSPALDSTTGLAINAFSRVGGSILNQAVVTQFDVYHPFQWMQLYVRNGRRPGFKLFLETMGFSMPKSSPTTGHYEKPWTNNLITFDAVDTAAAGAGNPIIFTIAATDMFDASLTVSGASSRAAYIRPGMDIVLYSGNIANVTAVNTATSPFKVTMIPKDPLVDMDAETTPGDVYFVAGNSWGEGEGLPAGQTPRIATYENTFQIIKHSAGATGSELTNKAYFTRGTEGSYYELMVDFDLNHEFFDYQSKGLLFGQQNTNPDLIRLNPKLGHDVSITGTEGFVPFVVNNAFEANYTPGTYAIDDFDAMALQLEGQWTGLRNFCGLMGIKLNQEIENVLLNSFPNQDDQYFMQLMGYNASDFPLYTASDYAIHIGFKSITKSGFTFSFKPLHEFNEILGAGSDGYDYNQWAIWTPIGEKNDSRTGESRAIVGFEYKALGTYQRNGQWETLNGVGTASYVNQSSASYEYDCREIGGVAELAFHGTCPNQMVLQRPA